MADLLGAMIVRQVRDLPDGTHLIEPMASLTLPAEARKDLETGAAEVIGAQLEGMVAVIVMHGGTPRTTHTLTWTITPPTSMALDLPHGAASFVWPSGSWSHRVNLEITGTLPVVASGKYGMNFLLDGIPLVQLIIPVVWSDEVPS